jgi:hypothetical protein
MLITLHAPNTEAVEMAMEVVSSGPTMVKCCEDDQDLGLAIFENLVIFELRWDAARWVKTEYVMTTTAVEKHRSLEEKETQFQEYRDPRPGRRLIRVFFSMNQRFWRSIYRCCYRGAGVRLRRA